MDFGERLKAIRLQKDLTQQQFAELLTNADVGEIKQKTVSRWEKGERVPSVKTILRISEAFDMPVEEMIKGTHEEKVIDAINKKKAIVDLTTVASRSNYDFFIDGTELTEKEMNFFVELYRTAKKSFV